jgi:hypothetical protein
MLQNQQTNADKCSCEIAEAAPHYWSPKVDKRQRYPSDHAAAIVVAAKRVVGSSIHSMTFFVINPSIWWWWSESHCWTLGESISTAHSICAAERTLLFLYCMPEGFFSALPPHSLRQCCCISLYYFIIALCHQIDLVSHMQCRLHWIIVPIPTLLYNK